MIIEVVVTWKHARTHTLFTVFLVHHVCMMCQGVMPAWPVRSNVPSFCQILIWVGWQVGGSVYWVGRCCLRLLVVVVVASWCFMQDHCPTNVVATSKIRFLWNTSNHIYQTMNFVQQMLCSVHVSTKNALCVRIEDSTVFVGGLNFDTTSEGRAMRPVCVPWTCVWKDGICARFTTTLCSSGRSDLCSNLHCEGHWQAKRPGSKWIMTVLAHVPFAVCAKAAARWNTKRRRLRNWLFNNLMVRSWMVGSCMWLVEQLQDLVTQITFKQSPFSWAAG